MTVWASDMEISLSDATVLTVGGRNGFGEKRTLSFVPSTLRKPKSGVQLRACFGAPLDRLNAGNAQHFCSKILVYKFMAQSWGQDVIYANPQITDDKPLSRCRSFEKQVPLLTISLSITSHWDLALSSSPNEYGRSDSDTKPLPPE